MDNLFSVEGKNALVTGGSSGIGEMIARGLLQAGAHVFIASRDCGEAAQALSKYGDCTALPGDLATQAGIGAIASAFLAKAGALHILVNCAGTTAEAPIDDFSEAVWDDVMDLNLKAPFFLTQKLLPALRAAATEADPASVINISSIGGMKVFTRENYPYGASKAGLHQLTRTMARRLGPEHITVNVIAPGFFPSKMSAPTPQKIADARAAIPLRRIGGPDDITGLTVFLASRAGAFITGAVIPLDGGMNF